MSLSCLIISCLLANHNSTQTECATAQITTHETNATLTLLYEENSINATAPCDCVIDSTINRRKRIHYIVAVCIYGYTAASAFGHQVYGVAS
jgi:hypothetical protein